jgi:translation initiation factor 2 gamma subunit (eIF-2gamma)
VKSIQTEIDEYLHTLLKNISSRKKKSIEHIVRDAIEEYVKKYENELEQDPLFDIIGSFETEEGTWSERDEWRT